MQSVARIDHPPGKLCHWRKPSSNTCFRQRKARERLVKAAHVARILPVAIVAVALGVGNYDLGEVLMTGKIVILGAGPTGLGAAYRLKELGYNNFQMYERSPHIGGLPSSFTDSARFTSDIGGHVMFSHFKYYDDVFDKLMGKDFQLNMRECWVRMFNSWVPYPFQNNIRYLPKEITYECLTGLVEAQTKRDHKAAKNFKEFMDAVFGDGIVKHFMEPYNFKVWAHPPRMMNKEWIGERGAALDINRAIQNVLTGTDDFGWGPNNQFKFPLFGGTGEFYRRFATPLEGHVT